MFQRLDSISFSVVDPSAIPMQRVQKLVSIASNLLSKHGARHG
jgi:hypothetical protein